MAGILKVDQLQSDSNLAFNVAGANVAFMDATNLKMTSSNLSLAGTNVITNGKLLTTAQPTGAVLQVAQAVKSDGVVISGLAAQWTSVTGLSVVITPSSASSKILVILHVGINGAGGASISRGRITRNGTAVGIGDAAGSRARGIGQAYHFIGGQSEGGFTQGVISTTFLDSPATTSSLTYQFQVGGDENGTVYINRTQNDRDNAYTDNRGISTITVMEIAG
jgi:hypothetical protein